jgi:hypothetical protein
MTENYIQFKKQRELGDIITDTFSFIRANYKLLFKLIFKIAGPAFLVLLLALTYYSYLSLETLETSLLDMAATLDVGTYLITGAVLLFSMLAFSVLLYGTVLHFIQSYIKNNGTVLEDEVKQGVKYDFGNLLGLLVLCGIILFFGLILCVIPGVYLWVPISIAPAVMVFGRQSISDAIGEAFKLIKDNWWMTFFTLLVMTILVYIIGLIFQIPLFIYYFIKTFTMAQEGSAADPSTLFDWVYVVFNVISNLAQYLLSTIIVVATAFIYYDLNEKKNFTGTYETISNLGSSETR